MSDAAKEGQEKPVLSRDPALEAEAAEAVGQERRATTFYRPNASWQQRAAAVLMRATIRPGQAFLATIGLLPWPAPVVSFVVGLVDFFAQAVIFPVKGYTSAKIALPHCRARWYWPEAGPDQSSGRVVLYLHGGAFIFCGMNTHKRLATRLAQYAGAHVLIVGYQQLPYHTIDESLRQCVDGYRWLLDQGWSAEQIVFAGDSAGGYLVFATALAAQEEGLPVPAGIAAIAPFADWEMNGKIEHPNLRRDPVFSPAALRYFERNIRDVKGRSTGLLPTLHDFYTADLAALPPTLIHVAGEEMLLVDSERLAGALARAGVPTTLTVWAGAVHVFQAGDRLFPEALASLKELGGFIRDVAPAAV